MIKWAEFFSALQNVFQKQGPVKKRQVFSAIEATCDTSYDQVVLSVLHYLLLLGDLSAGILLRNV